MLDQLAGQLENYLSLLSARQKLTAANLANVDTPGYKAKDIDFQNELLRAGENRPLEITEVSGLVTKSDGNNVSLDRESRMLAENAMRFSAVSQLLRGQIRAVRSAIQEGKSA